MLVNSKNKHLNMQEIIKIALRQTESEHSFKVAFLAIIKELTLPNAKPIRIGNTLFIVHSSPKDPAHAMFRALNADTAINYLENSKKFIKEAKKMKIKVLVSQFKSSSILNIFKMISKNPPFKGMGFSASKTSDGGYQAVINMGDE
jgi:hypothetical protein